MNVDTKPQSTFVKSAGASDLTSIFFTFFCRKHHPVVDVVKEHRTLSKLLSSTLGSIIAWAKSPESYLGSQERATRGEIFSIFGHWLQTSTATGRLSMEDPNLQV